MTNDLILFHNTQTIYNIRYIIRVIIIIRLIIIKNYLNSIHKNLGRENMSVNQLESTLQAITHTLAKLEKDGCSDEKLLKELRKERDKLLNELNLN